MIFQCILGDIPSNLRNTRKASIFFRKDGTLKGFWQHQKSNLLTILRTAFFRKII